MFNRYKEITRRVSVYKSFQQHLSIESTSFILLRQETLMYSTLEGVPLTNNTLMQRQSCAYKIVYITIAYASLMVKLQQDGYTSKTRESQKIEGNRAIRFVCLGVASYLPVLYFPASACQKCLL